MSRQLTADQDRELRGFLRNLGEAPAAAPSPADSYDGRLATLSAQMSEAYRWARVDRRTKHFQPLHR